MTTHELARRLLGGPDVAVWVEMPFDSEESCRGAVSFRYDTEPAGTATVALITTTLEEAAWPPGKT